jgi:hypothetical protein
MNQDPVAEFGIGQTVGLIDPTPHGAGIAFDFSGKKLNFEQVFKYIRGHYSTDFVTVRSNLTTKISLSIRGMWQKHHIFTSNVISNVNT